MIFSTEFLFFAFVFLSVNISGIFGFGMVNEPKIYKNVKFLRPGIYVFMLIKEIKNIRFVIQTHLNKHITSTLELYNSSHLDILLYIFS